MSGQYCSVLVLGTIWHAHHSSCWCHNPSSFFSFSFLDIRLMVLALLPDKGLAGWVVTRFNLPIIILRTRTRAFKACYVALITMWSMFTSVLCRYDMDVVLSNHEVRTYMPTTRNHSMSSHSTRDVFDTYTSHHIICPEPTYFQLTYVCLKLIQNWMQ